MCVAHVFRPSTSRIPLAIAFGALVPVLVFLLVLPILAGDFDDLVGYAVIAKETVDEFTGCEHGKIIQFQSKRWVTCNAYGYQSEHHVDVALLARGDMYKGQRHLSCKMAVEEKLYDVLCEAYISTQAAKLLALHRHIKEDDLKTYLGRKLKLWEGAGLLSGSVASP